ncbi:Acg family FMN-binding oxidoreductase, partial [Streptomyces fradiae]
MTTTAPPDTATLEKLISASVAAPSMYNTQPWRYRLDTATDTVEIRAAAERALRHADPVGRALHVSVGAALFNLRVAAAHLGWEPVVRLLPRPGEPDLLAAVRLAGQPLRGSHRPDLYEALWHRHSSRFPYSAHPLPTRLPAELTEAAHAEGVLLSFPGPSETTRLLRVTAEGERRNTHDQLRRAESRRWIREGTADGMPGSVLGPQDSMGQLPMRDFAGLRPSGRPSAVFERRPVIAVLSTTHDRRADWLRAGQALEHVLLVATAEGVRASMLHQG